MSELSNDPIGIVICTYISAHPGTMTMDEMRDVIMNVRRAFAADLTIPEPAPVIEPKVEKKSLKEVKASIRADGIVSFEDGKVYKSLKRHLTRLGMTPQDYKTKYGLHESYPMVAPDYSRKRSELAKKMGLGTNHR